MIHLQNHAPGLQEREIQYLFDRFYTTDPPRHRKSTGLGLSIARRLVDMMEGEITAVKKGENLIVSIQFDLIK
ncbi:ATP-binding protein [Virgibacillus doumboii]|uniref:ATP-binding protein n=1 Tax=Virgibacillus doumboii TaxID=2697503 RepID=UPI0013DF610F|nr:sensor histidine kinase [Virgibacillus doumboii]